MRKMMFTACLLAFAAPALAQPALEQPAPLDPRDRELVEALPHPYEVEEMGDRLGQAVGALADVPVGGLINALDPAARAHPGTSIGDLAGRDDPHFRERMRDEVTGMSLKMADLVRGMAAAAPEVRRSLEELQRSLGSALGAFDY